MVALPAVQSCQNGKWYVNGYAMLSEDARRDKGLWTHRRKEKIGWKKKVFKGRQNIGSQKHKFLRTGLSSLQGVRNEVSKTISKK